LGCPSLRGDTLPLNLHPPRLEPLADEFQQGPLINADPPPVQPPGVVHRVKEALASGLYPIALSSVLQSEGEVADRIQRPASGALAVPALQKILRLDCRPQLRPGSLPPCIFERRYAAWPFLPGCLGNITASDQFGPVTLRLQTLRQCLTVGLQVHGLRLSRDVLTPTGSGLVQVLPAGAAPVGIQAPLQIPQPVWLVSACWVGSPPQGGWLLCLRSDGVRQQFPGRAADVRHVRPRVVGFPHR